MAQRKEAVDKQCEVSGCSEPAQRAVNAKKAKNSGLSISIERGNVHLCKEHYREFKKSTKEDRKLQRIGW
ncbi:MAG: hypothetical protein ACMUHU_02040 [Thermoplasmatota archaeon]